MEAGLNRRDLLRRGVGAAAATTLSGPAAAVAAPPRVGRRRGSRDYLLGFETLEREVAIPRLRVSGRLPRWLSGTLVRNGPGRHEVGRRTFNHWFDGLSMLHAFSFSQGRVSYANRFLRSSAHEAAVKEEKIRYSEFATDPCRSIFNGAAAMYSPAPVPNACVNVARLGERFVALTEVPLPVVFDPRTLETLGVAGPAPDTQLGTAHPHHDPRTGETLAYEVRFLPPTAYVMTSFRDGKRHEIGSIPVREPAYIHSFAITERHLVLAEYPLVVDPAKLIANWEPFIENYRWKPDRGTRFHVLDRQTGKLRTTISTEAFFAFHHINAFDRGAEIVLDIVGFDDAGVIDDLYLARLRGRTERRAPGFGPRRYTLDLQRRRATRRALGETGLELPRINYERVNGRPYRFAYGVGIRDERTSGFFDQIVKLDVETGKTAIWREPGCFPGEPVFVPDPRGRSEDDGLALSVVLDGRARTSFLLALDARTFKERARAMVPHHIPFGFHGALFEPPPA